MIIRTLSYTLEEQVHIIRIRATIESLQIDEAALMLLAEIGSRTSLRSVEVAHMHTYSRCTLLTLHTHIRLCVHAQMHCTSSLCGCIYRLHRHVTHRTLSHQKHRTNSSRET